MADGTFAPIAGADAVAEVEARVQDLIAHYGPNSIAVYSGTGPVSHPSGTGIAKAWMRAIMLENLAVLHSLSATENPSHAAYPLRLVCRRANRFMNSMGQTLPALTDGIVATPAFMHSADLVAADLAAGDTITISSPHGRMRATVA